MAINTFLFTDRCNEIAAATQLEQLAARISELAKDPYTKRFVRGRSDAAKYWITIRELAANRAAAAAKPATTVKRAVKRAPRDAVPITTGTVAEPATAANATAAA